jgi:peptide/nickel transport system ATP-binding protein
MAQLEIDNLSVEFRTRHGVVRALEGVTFSVARGEILGVVGESGSGKSVTAYTVMKLND